VVIELAICRSGDLVTHLVTWRSIHGTPDRTISRSITGSPHPQITSFTHLSSL
jgi:hypothetical protein